jgi:hypothetical protein
LVQGFSPPKPLIASKSTSYIPNNKDPNGQAGGRTGGRAHENMHNDINIIDMIAKRYLCLVLPTGMDAREDQQHRPQNLREDYQ